MYCIYVYSIYHIFILKKYMDGKLYEVFSIKKYAKEIKITILGKDFLIKHDYEKSVIKNYAKKLKSLQSIYGKRKIKVGFL